MSEPFKAFKGFFSKNFSEIRFLKAGKGRRLNDENNDQPSTSNVSEPVQRPTFSHEAQKAGQAALSRFTQGNEKKPVVRVTSLSQKNVPTGDSLENVEKFNKDVINMKIEEETRVNTPHFLCPCLGSEVLTREEWMPRIKYFLSELMRENPDNLIYAVTLIKTVNDLDKANFACEKLKVCLQNIIDNPHEEKFRKIRSNNALFRDKILPVEGCETFLFMCGFSYVTIDEVQYLIYSPPVEDMDKLKSSIELLDEAEPVEMILDRNSKVINSSNRPAQVESDDFFNLTTAEVRSEAAKRQEEIEEMKIVKLRSSKGTSPAPDVEFALIKIKFPDGMNLQGTFRAVETVQDIRQFVFDHLKSKSEAFNLLTGLGRNVLNPEKTLIEEKLTPSSLIHFEWRRDEGASSGDLGYLKDDLIA